MLELIYILGALLVGSWFGIGVGWVLFGREPKDERYRIPESKSMFKHNESFTEFNELRRK